MRTFLNQKEIEGNRMVLDPTKNPDWKIAEEAEKNMHSIYEMAAKLNLSDKELLPYGHYMGEVDYKGILERHKNTNKKIDVDVETGRVHGIF